MNVYLYQNNTEKILKNIYIGEYGWKPGSNTVAYFPLETDTLDHSGNGVILTTGTATQQTVGYSIIGQARTTIANNGIQTISMRFNLQGVTDLYDTSLCEVDSTTAPYFFKHLNSSLNQRFVFFNTDSTYTTYSYPLSTQTRYNMAIVSDKTELKTSFYINGNKVWEQQGIGYNFGGIVAWYWQYRDGNQSITGDKACILSQLIAEDIPRTEQEIQNYYNSTKSNYGL